MMSRLCDDRTSMSARAFVAAGSCVSPSDERELKLNDRDRNRPLARWLYREVQPIYRALAQTAAMHGDGLAGEGH